ncbi:MAG TPA: MarR family winged helix-turn-helix transcriptional regulator [Chloroflexota bacterium]|nr:MarR family winged helix-turn-helix transcriptional regulator [Chloroflexota bacterium]
MTELIVVPGTAARLIELTSSLRRALRRHAGTSGVVPCLSDAQRELMRTVRRHPNIRVGEAAAQLSLAGNTVSTLVSGLCADGWLEREVDPKDARSARIRLSLKAEVAVAQWRDRREGALERALAELGWEQVETIDRALPALEALVAQLQENE